MTRAKVGRFLSIALIVSGAWAQDANLQPLTIEQAVNRSRQFPSIEAAQEQVNAAAPAFASRGQIICRA